VNANFKSQATAGKEGGSVLLDQIVNAISSVFARLGSIVTNTKIVPVAFTAGATDVIVAHGLGFAVTSWDVVDLDANAVVYRSPTSNPLPQRQIILRASAACNAKVRFE